MPRKKMQRRQTTKGKQEQNLRVELEKEFRQVPLKLAALCQKELAEIKQKEKKLSNELTKLTAQRNGLQSKQQQLMQKATPAAKKQLTTIKKTYGQFSQSIKDLTKQLTQLAKQTQELSQKQALFSALNKELAKLEKQLIAKIKASSSQKPKASAKPKTAKRASSSSETRTRKAAQMKEEAPRLTQLKETVPYQPVSDEVSTQTMEEETIS